MIREEYDITSLQNGRIKEVVKLRDKRDRDRTREFLIEGYRELLRASETGVQLETLFYCPNLWLGLNEEELIEAFAATGAELLSCSKDVFAKMSYRDRPDGLLGVGRQWKMELNEIVPDNVNPLLIVAEAIEKPGNLGTILRCADGVGVDGVIVSDPCTDIFNPNVVRASVGTLFTVPVVEAKGDEALAWLKEKGILIVAATPAAELDYTEADFTGPIAVAVGTEQLGLSKAWMDAADIKVKIPMAGRADSLNVAMATTILLYEAARQRRAKVENSI